MCYVVRETLASHAHTHAHAHIHKYHCHERWYQQKYAKHCCNTSDEMTQPTHFVHQLLSFISFASFVKNFLTRIHLRRTLMRKTFEDFSTFHICVRVCKVNMHIFAFYNLCVRSLVLLFTRSTQSLTSQIFTKMVNGDILQHERNVICCLVLTKAPE